MRNSLLLSAGLLVLTAGMAVAQVGAGAATGNSTGVTQSPPNSGAPLEAAPAVPRTPIRRHAQARRPMRPAQGMAARDQAAAMPDDGTAPPTSAYRGGAGSPTSTQASNTTSANTRSEIAPRLPDPNAGSNSPHALLVAADRALTQGRTGAAQEALERAETRMLSRSTEASMAGQPDDAAMVRSISDARRALASRNMGAARSAIAMALQADAPASAMPPARAY